MGAVSRAAGYFCRCMAFLEYLLPASSVLPRPGGRVRDATRCRKGDLSPASPVYSGSWLNRFSPSPRPPSPPGKGESLSLFCRGLSPPAPLRLRRTGHGVPEGLRNPEGDCPGVPGKPPVNRKASRYSHGDARGEAPAKNFSAAADVHALFTDIWYTGIDTNQPDNRRRR